MVFVRAIVISDCNSEGQATFETVLLGQPDSNVLQNEPPRNLSYQALP